MKNIDFSKAPEGATHYAVVFSAGNPVIEWVRLVGGCFYNCNGCVGYSEYINLLGNGIEITTIPIVVVCNTEREKMLCEQVLRMCRGEKSQIKHKVHGDWNDLRDNPVCLSIEEEYRSKPKKELFVPWEFIPDCIDEITVSSNGDITYSVGYSLMLKLDLTDIDLPVTVKRPVEK